MPGRHYRRVLVMVTIVTIGLTLLMATSRRCNVWSLQCMGVEDPDDISNNLSTVKDYLNLSHNASLASKSIWIASNSSQYVKDYSTLQEAIKDRVNADGLVILSSVDFGYLEFAINLHETSFLRLGFDNFLFVSSDAEATSALKTLGIASVMIDQDVDGREASAFGSPAFIRKTHLKTFIVLEALKLGFSVLIVDVDIVFLENPLQYFKCQDCDIEIQLDGSEGNSGFYLARPTNSSIVLHQEALRIGQKSKWLSNQKAVDRIMEGMSRENVLKFKYLDINKFPHGELYFEQGKRMFAGDNPCKICVIVHNNWIMSGDAKVYRFKENLMWVVDDNKYYSSTTRKYLAYENPIDFGSWHTLQFEKEALRNGLSLSRLLNRTLILPTFHCYGCRYKPCRNRYKHCALNSHIRITKFNQIFSGKYREHMFLNHPKVPKEVKLSLSPVILITNPKVATVTLNNIDAKFTPGEFNLGESAEDFLHWVGKYGEFSVLRFHSLYGGFDEILKDLKTADWNLKQKIALTSADYRQY